MDNLLLVARLLLAAVFAAAGLTKLVDRDGARQAVVAFGVPTPLATPLGHALPLVELAVAAAFVPVTAVRWGAAGSLLLLLLFSVAIVLNLARGRAPDCHCFGQMSASPIGGMTLARNAILAACAGLILWGGAGRDLRGVFRSVPILEVVGGAIGVLALALLAAEGWLLLHLVRQNGRILRRLDALEGGVQGVGPDPGPDPASARLVVGLPVGVAAPSFALSDLSGVTVTLDSLRANGTTLLLVFLDPDCTACTALLSDVQGWQRDNAIDATPVLISIGTREGNKAAAEAYGLRHMLIQREREIVDMYGVTGTPSAVAVHADGTIASPLAEGVEAIRALVAGKVRRHGLPMVTTSLTTPD